jgi:hypothetical protein
LLSSRSWRRCAADAGADQRERAVGLTARITCAKSAWASNSYRDDNNERPPLLVNPGRNSGFPGGNTNYLEKGYAQYEFLHLLSDRTRGHIPIDLNWEYFGKAGDFTTSYAYHMGPLQQTTPEGRKWLADQIQRWNARFIVAACPWHRHLWQGWLKTDPKSGWGSRQTRIKDLALRYDGSVDSFVWPAKNWEEEPYVKNR